VTADYIAYLLYDNYEDEQVVRVFYRNETNFGLGHTHIRLNTFKNKISAISFLGYELCDTVFVRDPQKWETFAIHQNQLVVDSHEYIDLYRERVNNTYKVFIEAIDEYKSQTPVSLEFKVTFSDLMDMSTYFVSPQKKLNLTFVYGDQSFKEILDPYYSGPDKRFGIETKQFLR
jgi:hypothetical protein